MSHGVSTSSEKRDLPETQVVLGQVHDDLVQARNYLSKSLASNDLHEVSWERSPGG
ncbi:hypothetical protein SNL152K_7865 [Streptomyces sp. NL15-2K]|nr:hypothetical protein SNL152K_7865 [Streptomyces sp. NL15-2K]